MFKIIDSICVIKTVTNFTKYHAGTCTNQYFETRSLTRTALYRLVIELRHAEVLSIQLDVN